MSTLAREYPPRIVFISASFLVKEYKEVPKEEMDRAIFFFGSARSWVFPSNDAETREAKRQPTKYLDFPQDFKNIILEKEKRGLCLWLKPQKDYRLISQALQKIPIADESQLQETEEEAGVEKGGNPQKDESSAETTCEHEHKKESQASQQVKCFNALNLNPRFWKEECDVKKDAKYVHSGLRVASNFQQGDHDYSSVMELLHNSNPGTLVPLLTWESKQYN